MSKRDLDTALRALAERQHGLAGRSQSRELGASRRHLDQRLQSSDWQAVTSQVMRLVGSAETFEQRCMAAVLDAGHRSAISHQTAAALWCLPGFPADVIEVTRRRARSGRPTELAVLHEVRSLPDHHLTVAMGIPVTTVPRTIFDLAGCLHPQRAERALDNALARRLTSAKSLSRLTAELAKRGRQGSALMREMMAERGSAYMPPESGGEARFFDVLRAAGLPLPVPQRDLGGDHWVGRVDNLYPIERLVIEVDSSLHHSTALDRAEDARRDAEFHAAGFDVCRVREADIWRNPAVVVAQVRDALRRSGSSNGANSVAV